jgi:prepilin-type N-terminal cleavage/methylation domain-containing protein
MLLNRLLCRTARLTRRGGFTLVELLVVIGIIAILAGVALGPITHGIKQAQESGSMQVTRQIGLSEFSYSNDYNQTYPFGVVSEDIANTLLNGGYLSDPSIFYQAGTPNAVKGGGTTPYALTAVNVNFDFMVNKATGLSSTAADGTPLVQLTGGTLAMQALGPITCTILATETAFGTDGLAVSYKSNSAKFMKAIATSATQASIANFVDSSYNDPNAGNYTLLKP